MSEQISIQIDRAPLLDPREHLHLLTFPDDMVAATREMVAIAEERLGKQLELEAQAVQYQPVTGVDALATIRVQMGRKQELVAACKGHGPDLDSATTAAAYFAIRKLLFGDVAVCGVLFSSPEFQGALEFVSPSEYRLVIQTNNQRQFLTGLALSRSSRVSIRVSLEAARATSRTRYLKVRVGDVPVWLRARIGRSVNWATVRLHQFVAAFIGAELSSERHIHHDNGCGYDCRQSNLTSLSYQEHGRTHERFAARNDQEGPEVQRTLMEAVGGLAVTVHQPRPRTAKVCRHSREYGHLSWLRAWKAFRLGYREKPLPRVEDRDVLRTLSRRTDCLNHLLAVMDLLWDSGREMHIDEIVRALSLSKSTVRNLVARLSSVALLAVSIERRRQMIMAETWPSPLRIA